MKEKLINHPIVDRMPTVVQVERRSTEEIPINLPKRYHKHHSFQLVIIEQGHADFMVNAMLHRIEKGHLILMGSELPHGVLGFSENVRVTIIHIPYTVLSWCKEIPELEQGSQFIQRCQRGYLFTDASVYRKATMLSKRLQKSEGFQRVSQLFELLSVLSGDASAKSLVTNPDYEPLQQESDTQTSVDRAYSYLYKHFQENFTLDDVAHYAGQNRTALCRAFKKQSGYTLFEFTNRLRIEKACQLLKASNYTISQIAFQVGFNTYSHFTVQFQRLIQLSPTRYREKSEC